MADKAISELIAANQVTPTDLFVLEQSGTAKKLTGQILENWLVSFADGHGGIQSIVKKSTSGLVDTYRITLADTTTFDFVVNNGRSINTITKTGTSGLVDTYTIQFNDNTSSTFTVTNGAKGDKGDNQYVWIKYASQKPTASSHSFGDVADNWIGIYSGDSATAPTDWTQYEWFQIKGEKGDTGEPAKLVTSAVEYQVGDSGTIIPSGAWSTSVPVVSQGRYMWTRTTNTFNTGSSVISYSVSRMGIDGTGSVSSVAGVSPSPDGNVPLTAANVGALPSSGGAMTGGLNMNGQKITGLNAPTDDDEAATKGYAVAKQSVVNNFTTTEEGFVADARALKALNDSKISMELLWVNGRPDIAFDAQPIGIDLSEYDRVRVEFIATTAYRYSFISECSVGNVLMVSFTWGDTGTYAQRSAGTSINGLTVNKANKDKTTDNTYCVPYKVYGIKGVST